ncbi:MAG TPA: MFS transporter [Chloroflexota bacterium]|nr:MFS transporter [Chloroflexota bacterium]
MVLTLAWFTAFSSRSTTISVGPVMPLIQSDLNLSFSQLGLLFSIPPLMMGLFAIPSGLIMARFGVKTVLLLSLSVLAVGCGLRAAAADIGSLYAFTALVGAGIGLVQPALPRLVKDHFRARTGVMTGIYSSGFAIGATTGAALAVPVLVPLFGRLSWRGPFIVWAALVAATALAWVFVPGGDSRPRESLAPFGRIFRSRLCWHISLIFMTQNVLFYVLNSWLAGYYQSLGYPLTLAATAVALLSAGSVVFGFGGPAISDRTGRKPPFVVAAVAGIFGILGLILVPTHLFWLWPFVCGSATAVLFTTSLVIPVDVSRADEVGAFSGMMLTVGYGGGILGPLVIGFLRDVTGSNLYSLLAMLFVCLVQLGLCIMMPETSPRHR